MQNNVPRPSDKIVSREVLAAIVQELKPQGKTIVSTNGSFDLLHFGHVTMLQEAKLLGDVLIVGLNSDASVRSYKGKYRPICPQAQRAGMLTALACTDYITIFDELTPIELLKVIQPHIHVNSPEHGKDCVEREVVERHGGQIYQAQLVEGMSTTQLIRRILDVSSHIPCQGIFIKFEDLFELDTIFSKFALLDKLKFVLLPETTLNALRQFSTRDYRIFVMVPETIQNCCEHIQEALIRQGLEMIRILCYPRHCGETGRMPVSKSSYQQSKRTLIEQAVAEFDIILARSFVISGEMADIQMGREINCKTVLLRKHANEQEDISGAAAPHFIALDFQEAANFVNG